MPTDIFSNMLAYAPELKRFLLNGGLLGWGIVPSEEEPLTTRDDFKSAGEFGRENRTFSQRGNS